MNLDVTHDRKEESIEAKTRWFKSLSLAERMDMLCAFTDLALILNPDLADKKDAQQTERSGNSSPKVCDHEVLHPRNLKC